MLNKSYQNDVSQKLNKYRNTTPTFSQKIALSLNSVNLRPDLQMPIN